MEQNLPVIAKKFWSMVRVALFMLGKGISKTKLKLELKLLMKRSKIPGKAAIQNLMFHHGRKSHHVTDDDILMVNAAVMKALEMLKSETATSGSPPNNLPGFGRMPTVRQLRVTDSPFPIRDVEEDNRVDEAAEEFISKFYNNLRRQASTSA